jgi:ABC-type Na+ transport system ATPase subunit NatA
MRITPPSQGEFETWGRVCGLLEVGSGFHPELTRRENVFLNAALHGLGRRETARRLDAIVAFAGLEDSLDTPMKRYSTGMYVRLAFAVAAHLDADVLLVDEVLSVGDAAFRQRCLVRLEEMRAERRSLVFVSHDLEALRASCARALLLEGGRLAGDGDCETLIARYLASATPSRFSPRARTGRPQVVSAELRDEAGRATARIRAGDALLVRVAYAVPRPQPGLRLAVTLTNAAGTCLGVSDTRDDRLEAPAWQGRHRLEVRLPGGLFEPGVFQIGVSLWDAGERLDGADSALALEVVPGRPGSAPDPLRPRAALRLPCEWSVALPEASLAE